MPKYIAKVIWTELRYHACDAEIEANNAREARAIAKRRVAEDDLPYHLQYEDDAGCGSDFTPAKLTSLTRQKGKT